MFNKKCDGTNQSPINITTASVAKTNSSILGPLKLENDWKPYTGKPKPAFTLSNKNGKTVQLDITTSADLGIKTKQHGKICSVNSDHQISFNFIIWDLIVTEFIFTTSQFSFID